MPSNIPVITIDGPSGTGKGTVSQLLAKELAWHFLDSGALYRVLALAAKQHAVDSDNADAITVLAQHLDVQFKTNDTASSPRIVLEGEDVTETIRLEAIGNLASKISAIGPVRAALLERQRAFREPPGLVTDGRDMGTVVFPDAFLKVYLDASQDVRAQRRFKQLKDKGINVNLQRVTEELVQRDQRDSQRSIAPLKPAGDALFIDTSALSKAEVLDRILREARARLR
jgi:cytidylate kinase